MGYFIRITPDEPVTLNDIQELVKSRLDPDKYVISEEYSHKNVLHFHIVLYSPFSSDRIRARIKTALPCQVYISGKEIMDKYKAIAYTIKDGHYVHYNVDVFEMMKASQLSHKKERYDTALKDLRLEYKEHSSDELMIRGLLDIYTKFGKRINRTHFMTHAQSIKYEVQTVSREALVQYTKDFIAFD